MYLFSDKVIGAINFHKLEIKMIFWKNSENGEWVFFQEMINISKQYYELSSCLSLLLKSKSP